MRVDELLESIEELLQNGWELPFSKGKGLTDVKKIQEVINEVKKEMPQEFEQAKAIVADRSQIIEEARNEAADIVKKAENKAAALIKREEIVKQSEIRAEAIINDAKKRSNDIKRAANDYVDDFMKRTDEVLTSNLADFRKSRQSLHSTQNAE